MEHTLPLALTLFWSAFLAVVVLRWDRMSHDRAFGNSLLGIGWVLYSLINLTQPARWYISIFVMLLAGLCWAGTVWFFYRGLQDNANV